MKLWIACTIMWIMSGLVIGLGIYFTKNANCLWALVISGFINVDFMNAIKETK